jgi:hypothetical protein
MPRVPLTVLRCATHSLPNGLSVLTLFITRLFLPTQKSDHWGNAFRFVFFNARPIAGQAPLPDMKTIKAGLYTNLYIIVPLFEDAYSDFAAPARALKFARTFRNPNRFPVFGSYFISNGTQISFIILTRTVPFTKILSRSSLAYKEVKL